MKRVLFLAIFCALVLSCNKDDDNSNANCSEPTDLTLDLIGTTSILFSWETGGETAWEIEYGETGFGTGAGTVLRTSQTNMLIDALEPATAYQIQLRSNCGSDGFSNSIIRDFTTLTGNPNCIAPSNLSLGLITSNSVEISWSENNETAWEIEYGLVNFTLGTGTVVQTSQNVFTITGLVAGNTYEIYVRANCGTDGYSEYSEQVVVSTNP